MARRVARPKQERDPWKDVTFVATPGMLSAIETGVAAARYASGDGSLSTSRFLRWSALLISEFWIEAAKKMAIERGVAGPNATEPSNRLCWAKSMDQFFMAKEVWCDGKQKTCARRPDPYWIRPKREVRKVPKNAPRRFSAAYGLDPRARLDKG